MLLQREGFPVKYVKLSKAALITSFATGVFYVVFGAIAYIFTSKLSEFSAVVTITASVGLWTGIVCVILSSITWILRSAGINKKGDCRAFLCSQLQFVATAVVFVGYGVAFVLIVFVFALASIGGEKHFSVWEKLFLIAYYLPEIAVMALNSISLGFAMRERRSPQGEGLPVNPYLGREDGISKGKFIVTVIESSIVTAFYLMMVVLALMS